MIYRVTNSVKVGPSPAKKNCFFDSNKNPLKEMKNAFISC